MEKTVEVPQWQVDVPRGASCAGSTGAVRGEDDGDSKSLEKSLRSLKFHTSGRPTCESLSTALGRPRMATRSSTDGHTVVHGWPHGRPRMATRSSTDGHRVVHGWPQGRPRMATGSSTDGHRVVHGWPQGRPRMATGSSTDGHRVVHGWPEGVHGWPKVLPSSRPRMAGVQKQGGGDVPQYIKMAARAASSRLSTDGPLVVRGWPNRCTYRR